MKPLLSIGFVFCLVLTLSGCAKEQAPIEKTELVPYSVSRENPFVKDPAVHFEFVKTRGAALEEAGFIDVLSDDHLKAKTLPMRSSDPRDKSIYAKQKGSYP